MQGIRGASKCHWLVHTTEQEAFSFVIESLCSITVGLYCQGIPQKVLQKFDARFDKKMPVKSSAIQKKFKSHELFQNYSSN